jgi:hypothetical protein
MLHYKFIVGSLISMVGSIVGAVAQDVNTLIVSEVLIGIAAAFQISFYWVGTPHECSLIQRLMQRRSYLNWFQ